MTRAVTCIAVSALALAACSMQRPQSVSAVGNEPTAGAQIATAAGDVVATAEIFQVNPQRLRVEIDASGLAPGTYGVHIHQAGRCDGPGFTSAGAHWNPTGRQHGSANPMGPHQGDLPNLTVDANGHGLLIYGISGSALRDGTNPLLDADGAAVVIHAGPDDYRTDPSGNSGARIACGVIG